jgi:hypothetical protein
MKPQVAAFALLLLGAQALDASAALVSKTFVFQPNAILDVGAEVEPGLRLDSVHFLVPQAGGDGYTRTAGNIQVEVALSNTGSASHRIGIALALYDEDGRLLGVASGGDKIFPLKAGRQGVYTLTFDHVNGSAAKATRFQVTVETRS